jgi:hypothetical protein
MNNLFPAEQWKNRQEQPELERGERFKNRMVTE